MNHVVKDDLLAGFERLGIAGKAVEVHASLSSFGHVEGGAETVVEALTEGFSTVLVPGFSYSADAMPPENDRPSHNALDYGKFDRFSDYSAPFSLETAPVYHRMGIISHLFSLREDVLRSFHPWHSWLAQGKNAEKLIEDHPWTSTNRPLESLAANGGWVILLGVTLTSCTAIHTAEERAGRRPFIRWAVDTEGIVRRVHVAGCAKGFDNLLPYCDGLLEETYVGDCRLLAAPLEPLINLLGKVIGEHPEITRCSSDCVRCEDSITGGPVD